MADDSQHRQRAPRVTAARPQPHFPHTTSSIGPRRTADCLSLQKDDNNAWMAQLLGFGTVTVNSLDATFTSAKPKAGSMPCLDRARMSPRPSSAVICTNWPTRQFPKHGENKGELKEAHHHGAREVLDLTLRANTSTQPNAPTASRFFDVANIDQKVFPSGSSALRFRRSATYLYPDQIRHCVTSRARSALTRCGIAAGE